MSLYDEDEIMEDPPSFDEDIGVPLDDEDMEDQVTKLGQRLFEIVFFISIHLHFPILIKSFSIFLLKTNFFFIITQIRLHKIFGPKFILINFSMCSLFHKKNPKLGLNYFWEGDG